MKCIACLVVILLHVRVPGIVGEGIIYGLRFPVPIFFMITGYYTYSKDNKWILKKSVGILKMIVVTEIIYGLYDIVVKCVFNDIAFNEYLHSFSDFPLFRVLIFGTFFNGTLWYLYAAFWTYIIIVLLRKVHIYENDIIVFVIICILISIQIQGFSYYRVYYPNQDDKIYLFRSAFLFGVPLELLGTQFAKHSEKINRLFSVKKSLMLISIGFIIMLLEFLFGIKGIDFHYSTMFISSGMFIFAMVYKGKQRKLYKFMGYIGKELSMLIYLAHIMVIDVLGIIINLFNLNSSIIVSYLKPVLAIIFSCVVAELIQKCNRYISKSRKT